MEDIRAIFGVGWRSSGGAVEELGVAVVQHSSTLLNTTQPLLCAAKAAGSNAEHIWQK